MYAMSTEAQVRKQLGAFHDPYMDQDLQSAGVVQELAVEEAGQVRVRIVLGYPAGDWALTLHDTLTRELLALDGVQEASVTVQSDILAHAVQVGVQPLPGVKNIIAVASGKGGVGKSTTAINLALALQHNGAQVGLMDADIYGPSQPRMLGCDRRPEATSEQSMEPLISHRLQSMSIGYLVDEETPTIWRGPMVTSALQQLLQQTHWQDLDYLVIDLPPGTGDIQLTLSQKIPVSGAVIVTTPQDISLLDARKSLKMFEKVRIPILGLVENMSSYHCPQCGHEEDIFGSGGGRSMAEQYDVTLLGQLPLDRSIREGADTGKPIVAMQPTSAISHIYLEIARRASARLALQGRDYSTKFPKIVVE